MFRNKGHHPVMKVNGAERLFQVPSLVRECLLVESHVLMQNRCWMKKFKNNLTRQAACQDPK